MKKATILVSFGTSHEDARNHSIEQIHQDIQAVNPEIVLEQAYTSGMILHKLSKEHIHINTVEEAVNHVRENKVECLYVIPTHMIPGIEYRKMLGILEQYRNDFQKIRVATPVLNTEKDCYDLVPILKEMYEMKEEYEYILMGHGSEDEANIRYVQMNQAFKAARFHNVRIASVEAKPDLDDAIEELQAHGNRKKVILYPFMVVAGDHAKNDMAGEENSYVSRLQDAGYQVEVHLKGLGEYPEFRRIYVDKFKNILKDEAI